MENIKVLTLLNKYKDWVTKGEIQFLKNGSKAQSEILRLLKDLITDFKEAEKKAGDLSENLDWAKTHNKGRKLWENLASASLNNIDCDSKGNSEIFNYLKAATEFEDLLYGLEPFYRDHTLHSLWVYFIGEYLLRDELPDLNKNLNWYLFNDIERDKTSYSPTLLKEAKQKEKYLCKKVNEKKDAIWCIMALCHDLGYSLAKLDKLNEKAKNVLKFFDIPNLRHIGYSLDIEHQYLISQFLELMSMEVRIVPNMDKKEVLIKCYRDDSTYWRLCKALEKKQHGILSSYLLYKILGIFADAWVRGPSEEWGLDDSEATDNLIRGDILFAIAQHEFDFSYINEIGGLAEILILADELEEFSRYGRDILSRKYYDTAADARISFKTSNSKQGKNIEIDIIYEVAPNRPINDFFIRKAERLSKIYSLKQEEDEKINKSKFYRIKNIKMTAEKGDIKYTFKLCRDNRNKGYLPGVEIKGRKYPKGEYSLECYDDGIFVDIKVEEIPLKDWFENVIN